MIKRLLSILLVCLLSTCIGFATPIVQLPPITIEILKEEVVTKDIIKVTVQLTAQDNATALVRDNVYLSYHVFEYGQDLSSNNLLRFENQRIPIVLDKNNCLTTYFNIDVSELLPTKVYIQMDVVDEKNAYWFSSKWDMTTYNIVFNRSRTDVFYKKTIFTITENPLIFLLNVSVFVSSITIFQLVKKKRILSFTKKKTKNEDMK